MKAMDDYMLVNMEAQGLQKPYPALKKVVPVAYKERPFKDLLNFMINPSVDDHGNAPLDETEKELAQEIYDMVDRSKSDNNYMVALDTYKGDQKLEQSFSLDDEVGSQPVVFEQRSAQHPRGGTVNYDTLDFKIQAYDAGGSHA